MGVPIPPGLDLRPLRDSYEIRRPDNVIESEIDIGDPKQRRRTRSKARPVSATFKLSSAEYALYDAWFETDLAGGVLWFDWTEPLSGAAVQAQFVGKERPAERRVAGGFVQITARLRVK